MLLLLLGTKVWVYSLRFGKTIFCSMSTFVVSFLFFNMGQKHNSFVVLIRHFLRYSKLKMMHEKYPLGKSQCTVTLPFIKIIGYIVPKKRLPNAYKMRKCSLVSRNSTCHIKCKMAKPKPIKLQARIFFFFRFFFYINTPYLRHFDITIINF